MRAAPGLSLVDSARASNPSLTYLVRVAPPRRTFSRLYQSSQPSASSFLRHHAHASEALTPDSHLPPRLSTHLPTSSPTLLPLVPPLALASVPLADVNNEYPANGEAGANIKTDSESAKFSADGSSAATSADQ